MPFISKPAVNGAQDGYHINGVTEKPAHDSKTASIAIIGLAGRFPGEATGARNLWDMCCEGRSAWSEIPEDRFNAEAYFHPNPSKSGCFNSRGAHFLKEDVGLFDAPFFGISPNEAKAMDPQQRLLLETTYEALENAGITLPTIAGTQTGVYVGAAQIDYTNLLLKDVDDIPVYQSTGTSANILSNRISYVFDLKGTSITMDTACSSSLAALHVACQSLRTGENKQVIVCGSHIMLAPDTMVGLSMLRLFGEDGISYTYDSRGSGYGRGEGVVSLVLKPLDLAMRDGDSIRAIVRNTGANQDGKTNGITFPSREAQANLMRSVYQSAGLDPIETAYVEAHGTGTAAGDPVEAEAISSVFTAKRAIDNPLHVGSVKTNVGHLEAASGLAAMVKTIFALEEGVIPPNINFEKPNKGIPLEEWKLKVPTSLVVWPNHLTRRASISNFGFGGTNVHVILEQYKPADYGDEYRQNGTIHANGHPVDTVEAPKTNGIISTQNSSRPLVSVECSRRRLFILSASDKIALRKQMHDLASYLDRQSDIDDEDILVRLAFTLCHRRSLLEWREAITASTVSELSSSLSSKAGEPVRPSGKVTFGFVFTGQGAQWFAMGRELLYYPIFAEILQEADHILAGLGAEWSLLDELSKDAESSSINRAYISQPATTAIQIALIRLLSSWGIEPSAVVGHSSGEIGAAYAAGALPLEQCMLIAYYRGTLAGTLKARRPDRPGGMLAIGASPAKVRLMIKKLGSTDVVIACVNGPSLVTVSGDVAAISEMEAYAEEESLFNRRLKVDVAYHSPHMQDIAGDYLAAIQSVKPKGEHCVQFHSSVVGQQIDTTELTAKYWVENMTSPVQFVDGVQSMYSSGKGPNILVEIGPHSALEAPTRDIMKNSSWASDVQYFSTLVRNCDATRTTLSLASALHVLGCSLNFSEINNPQGSPPPKLLDDLPSYPWNHSKRYWHESRLSVNHRLKRFPRSDLLGSLVDDFNDIEPRWRNIIRIVDIPWLSDHKVQGSIVFPATGYLSMVLEATSQYAVLHNLQMTPLTQYKLREVKISRPMVLSEDTSTEISLVMRPREEGSRSFSKTWMDFAISSWTSENGWGEHCQGLVSLHQNDQEPNPVNGQRHMTTQQDQYRNTIDDHQLRCQTSVDPVEVYSRFSRAGLEFGPAFQNLIAGRVTVDHAVGTISIPETSTMMPNDFESGLLIHPVTFDACLQVIDIASTGGDLSGSGLHVPTFLKDINICHGMPRTPGSELQVLATRHRPFSVFDPDVHASVIVLDAKDESKVLIQVEGFVGSELPSQATDGGQTGDRGLCYQTQWEPCLDLMTREQYAGTFTRHSNMENVTRQMEDLERAAFYHLETALELLSEQDIRVPQMHLQDLHRVLSKQLVQVQQGSSPFQASDWVSCNNDEKQRFLTRLASSDACGRLLCAMGENLVSIFDGEVEPLSIMLRENMLETFYRNNEHVMLANDYCADIAVKLAHQTPNMRIIEIGAGTGNCTMPILRALGQKFAHYDFTDISNGFFERAKEEQKEWDGKISYRKLNVEDDPVAQGFQPETYDLVVAANVLHATVNMENTMQNVRRLLRPGGKALIGEITLQLLSSTIIFGTLPGWWLGEETDRNDGPVLTETAWDTVYRKTGFSGLDGSVQVHGNGPSVGSVMLTTAIPKEKPTYPATSVVVCDKTSTKLAEAIRPSLHHLTGQLAPVENVLEVDLNEKYGIVLAMEESILSGFDEIGFKRMQALFSTAHGILWVSRGAKSRNPEANMITGFARTLRMENAGLRIVTLDLDDQERLPEEQVRDTILRVFRLTFGLDSPSLQADAEFLELNGVLQVPRIINNKRKDEYLVRETHSPVPESQPFVQPGRPLELRVGHVGQLDSIFFQDDLSLKHALGNDEIEISIKSTGMNFKDVMVALGQIPFYREIGVECSGIVTAVGSNVTDISPGSRVCAMTKGAYANYTRVPQHMVAKIPDSLGFAQAASIPVVFCTAHYALSDVGRLAEGESILIHAAAGGVGQAAIMLAQEAKAEVFVTVGSLDKKNLIMQTYGILESHVFSSRDTSFYLDLMAMTNQKGVDVVLNSTAGEILRQSWQCLAPLGRFLEIGKRDLVQNSNLEMEKFLDSVSFSAVDLTVLSDAKPKVFKRVLVDVIKMYEDNKIRLVAPITVYPVSEVQQAMRQMQSGKHTGKIVIEAASDSMVQALPAVPPKAIPDGAASYLITGGTGGIGRSITRWLAREGAKHIILVSRSGTSQKGVPDLVEELREQGVNLVVAKCDVADLAQVQNVVSGCQVSMPPIKGVIHGAMTLRDTLYEKISFADWEAVVKPRVQGAWNIHHCLADSQLEFFLMLSSGTGITGNRGQSAYCATNTFLDAFASYRKGLGLPACAIDIGIVESVGYVAENKEREADILVAAHDHLTENELLTLVKAAVTGEYSGNEDQQTITGCKLFPDRSLPLWASDPRFSHVLADVQSGLSVGAGDKEGLAVQHRLKQADSPEQAVELMCQALTQKLSKLLMIATEDVDRKKPVVAYGLDSLVAVELRNWITVDLCVNVPLMELMNSPSIEHLAGRIATKSKLVDQSLFAEEKEDEVQ